MIKMNKRITGKVKWYNQEKRFGFIESNEVNDCMVNYNNIITMNIYKTLYEGQIVEFEAIEGNKGLEAINVILKDTPEEEKDKILKDISNQIESLVIHLRELKALKTSIIDMKG